MGPMKGEFTGLWFMALELRDVDLLYGSSDLRYVPADHV